MASTPVTVKIKTRFDGVIEVEGLDYGTVVRIPVLAKAPTGAKTYATNVTLCRSEDFDPTREYSAPSSAVVRNRRWSVIAVGAEAAATETNCY